jgi:hypothetical protein
MSTWPEKEKVKWLRLVQLLGVFLAVGWGPFMFIWDTRPGFEYLPGALYSLLLIPIGLFLFIVCERWEVPA